MMLNGSLLRYHARQLAFSPATGVFLGFGWVLGALLTLAYGDFIAANHAGLELLFGYLPWVLCLLVPALTMTVADERRRGVEERLLTLPHTPVQRLAARFVVYWLLVGMWLAGFWPMVATVFYLGMPDVGPMLAGFVGMWLLAALMLAAALAAGTLASTSTSGFLVGFAACGALVLAGAPQTLEWFGQALPGSVTGKVLHALQSATPFATVVPFTLGFMGLGAVLYLAGLTLVLLAFALAGRAGTYRAHKPLWAAAVVGLGLVFVSALPPVARLGVDVTADRLHTLSPASVRILKNLPETVTLTLYESRTNPDVPPQVHTNAQALRRLLANAQARAGGRLKVEDVNPDASIALAVKALQDGASEQTLPSGTGYFAALIARMGEKHSGIAALNPQRQAFLEFDVMSLLTEVERKTKPTISLLTAIDLDSPLQRPRWMNDVGTAYNFVPLELNAAEVPAESNLLMVVGNPVLPEATLGAVKTYLQNGGKVVFLADALWRTRPERLRVTEGSRTLADVLKEWGIVVDEKMVVGDDSQPTPVAQEKTGYTAYPFWLSLDAGNVNPRLPFATFVSSLLLAEAGEVREQGLAPGLTFTPILSSSNKAQLLDRGTFNTVPGQLLAGQLGGVRGRHVLAALVTGRFGTAATGAGASAKSESPKPESAKLESAKAESAKAATAKTAAVNKGTEGTLLVVNDLDWLTPNFALRATSNGGPGSPVDYEPLNDNLTLFFNMLQYALGETELIELRGKATTARPLTRVEALLAQLAHSTTVMEQKLAAQLYDVSQRLEQMRADNPDFASLTEMQLMEVKSYHRQEFELRQQLREIRHQARRQLQQMQTALLVLNVMLMPTLLGVGYWFWRRRRKKAAGA